MMYTQRVLLATFARICTQADIFIQILHLLGRRMRLIFLSWIAFSAIAMGVIDISESQVNIVIAPGFNHTDLSIPFTSTGGVVSVSSDSPWVSASVDAGQGNIRLVFSTSNLVTSSSTATITATNSTGNDTFFVTTHLSPLNITQLIDDPFRSRMYGIQQNGVDEGCVLVIDPLSGDHVGCVSSGNKPTDLAISNDGSELFVINSADESISVFDLSTLLLKETISLPAYDNWGVSSTTADIAVGPGNTIYYSDGAWAPVLRVYDRSTGTVKQSVTHSGNGFGDFALNADRSMLYGWVQYGWSAGSASTYLVRYSVNADGTLSLEEYGASNYPTLARDPLYSPVFVDNKSEFVFMKKLRVNTEAITITEASFPSEIYSISPGGEIVGTKTAIYERKTGNKLLDLQGSPTAQAISSDYARFVSFNTSTKSLDIMDLMSAIGADILNKDLSPEDKSITLAPDQLIWSSVPGVDLYDVYWGSSELDIQNADTQSAFYQGQVSGSQLAVSSSSFAAGQTYYWRVDPVSQAGASQGVVYSFTVSTISSDLTEIDTVTVQGHNNHQVTLQLDSASPMDWRIEADQPWVSFVNSTGQTPASVTVQLDATALSAAVHSANLTIFSGTNSLFTIPVSLEVEALNLRHMKSDPNSVFSYAISGGSSASEAAYLLEINSLTEQITRVLPVGSSVTDLAIHNGDNRIYVPNWLTGSLLAVNKQSFELERTYGFNAFGGTGYGDGDVYRVSAGAPGRLIVEEEDQWIDVTIFDTATATTLATTFEREGGGCSTMNGRYYYHGDNNSSGAELHKFDLVGDAFIELAQKRVTSGGYYGSRTVTVSDDGQRIFWNGSVFDTDLNIEWTLGEHIYSCNSDGSLAFAENNIYDIPNKQIIGTLPVTTSVSTYQPITSKLLYSSNSTIGFIHFEDKSGSFPEDASIITSPDALSWSEVPTATEYQVYLGSSEADVLSAGSGSSLHLGSSSTSSYVLGSSLPDGTYYWRVDSITPYGTLASSVYSFTVASLRPGFTQIDAETVQGHRAYKIELPLDAGGMPTDWSLATDASWIHFNMSTGVTPSFVEISLDASNLAVSNHTGAIEVYSNGSLAFTLPVELNVAALKLTHIQSDPTSEFMYAISGGSTASEKAYLLEIDTQSEEITRVAPAGSSVTDIAIHNGDNRIYIPNWQLGKLLAVNKSSFELEHTYSYGEVYRVSAGAPGRLIVEQEDQWIDVAIFDTASGTKLATTSEREGGGRSSMNGRYYYHGDNNISNASLHKFDLLGDAFSELTYKRVTSGGYYGSRTVTVSADGQRIFWNGSVFSPDLTEEWEIGEHIYACSSNGALAFAQSNIYDIPSQQVALKMPITTTVSALNSTTSKLVVQQGDKIAFYHITSPLSLPAPSLLTGLVSAASVELHWTDESLETGFTLQMRKTGLSAWQEINAPITANTTNVLVSGLDELTGYEFRIKADSPVVSSGWSPIVTATTLVTPLSTPQLLTPSVSATQVSLFWSDVLGEENYLIERLDDQASSWLLLGTNAANAVSYVDNSVSPTNTYSYRVKAISQTKESAWSTVVEITTPQLPAPSAPTGLSARAVSSREVAVQWDDVLAESGYILERRTEDLQSWVPIHTNSASGSGTIDFIDNMVTAHTEYWYRVQAYNSIGRSPYSNEDSAVPMDITYILYDDFDPSIDSVMWTAISGGSATNFGSGFYAGNGLWFSDSSIRSAESIPLDLRLGGTLSFKMRAGNENSDGWNNSESGEMVVLEYSIDGTTWSTLQTLNTVYPSLSDWTSFSIAMPAEALTAGTRLRWKQSQHSGLNYDVWAIDDVVVEGATPLPPTTPPFLLSSPNSATSVSLFWAESMGATSYTVERSSFGQPWTTLVNLPSTQSYFTDTTCAPGTFYSYRVAAVNAAASSPFSSVSYASTYTRLEDWLVRNYGVREPVGEAALLMKDENGIDNLTKYAFNMNVADSMSHQPGSGTCGIPAIWLEGGQFRIEFMRRKSSSNPGIRYEVQVSESIGNWISIGSLETSTSVDHIWERVRVEDSNCPTNCSTRFVRVIVTKE